MWNEGFLNLGRNLLMKATCTCGHKFKGSPYDVLNEFEQHVLFGRSWNEPPSEVHKLRYRGRLVTNKMKFYVGTAA